MCLPGSVSTAAALTVVLEAHRGLRLTKSVAHPLPSKHHTVEVFAEDLSGFIVNFVLRVDHDDILGAALEEDLANGLRMAAVDKHQFRDALCLLQKNLLYFFPVDAAQSSNIVP